ncbi:MAG: BamA/TamA family outer membrane protein [Candidatus Neomarinimicrobiota bacterium]
MHGFRRILLISICLFQPIDLSAQVDHLPIGSINFVGNEAIGPEQLLALMKLKAVRGFAFRDQPFSRRVLRLDAMTLEGFYASQGYLESSVSDSFVVNASGSVDIYLTVNEGRQYLLADVTVSGNRSLSTEEIITFLELQTGEPYNPVYVRYRLNELHRYYQNQGKLTIDILDEKEANGNVHLYLFISEGLTYTIGRINITGLENVPVKYLQREILFQPGDTFRRDDMVLSQQRIFESGLFSGVEIMPEIRSLDSAIADVAIQVRELERRSLDLTLGFRQKPSLGAGEPSTAIATSGQWWHSRILNTSIRSGITAETDLALEDITSPNLFLSWEFQVPWTLGIRIPSSIKFFSDYRTTPDQIYMSGVEVSLIGRRVRQSRFSGRFRWARITAEKTVLDSVATAGANRSISLNYLYQGVDDLLTPRRGTVFQINPSVNGIDLEDVAYDVTYYFKLEADIRRYHPLGREAVFAYRLKAGFLQSMAKGSERNVPPIELFDLGGSTSLRGWSSPNSFSSEGGIIKVFSNVELRFPLIWLLGATIFLDAGGLKAFVDESSPELDWKLGWDAGLGLQLTTALGPIRLDAALPQGDEAGQETVYQMAFLYIF